MGRGGGSEGVGGGGSVWLVKQRGAYEGEGWEWSWGGGAGELGEQEAGEQTGVQRNAGRNKTRTDAVSAKKTTVYIMVAFPKDFQEVLQHDILSSC